MDFDTYQRSAHTTACYPEAGRLTYPALKLAGEAGEVAEKLGKAIRSGQWKPGQALESQDVKQGLVKELGDVLWYVAEIATELGLPLSYVAEANLAKLSSRQERGVLDGNGDER